jgi:hypothetical protein
MNKMYPVCLALMLAACGSGERAPEEKGPLSDGRGAGVGHHFKPGTPVPTPSPTAGNSE